MVSSLNRPTEQDIARAREQYRLQLVQDEEETVARLLDAYTRILRPNGAIDRAMNELVNRIVTMEEPSRQDVQDLQAFQNLLATVRTDMEGFQAIYQNEAGRVSQNAAQIANDSALAMTQANVPVASPEIALAWNQPNPEALADLVSIVDNETWRTRQNEFAENASEHIADVILTGVAQGKHSSFTARFLMNAFDYPFSWADNTVRTAQIYSYRRASHLSYASNSRFIEGWVWQAALDNRTCLSCVSQHGKFYESDRILNDHHRGRCTPLPRVKGTKWHDSMTTGEEWFRGLTPAEHKAYRANIRNDKLYDAVLDGDIPFDRLSATYQDGVYGDMLRQATYKEASR